LAKAHELNAETHTAIWLYLARARNGTDGKPELTANTQNIDVTKWPAPAVALYRGIQAPDGFVALAANSDANTQINQMCEANFYLGQWYLLKGKQAQARSHFTAARDACPPHWFQYGGAVAELARMK